MQTSAKEENVYSQTIAALGQLCHERRELVNPLLLIALSSGCTESSGTCIEDKFTSGSLKL